MAMPIQKGLHINLLHKRITGYYDMPAAESYNDYYGIGYSYCGDRLISTPDKTIICNGKYLCFMHKNLCHRTSSLTDRPYESMQIKISEAAAERLMDFIGDEIFEQLFSQMLFFFNEKTQTKIEQILKNMEEEWNHFDNYSEKILENLLYQLVVTCIREHLQKTAPEQSSFIPGSETQVLLNKAIQYVKTHFRENPSLTETARAVHISAPYLSKLFTDYLETSYSVFLNTEKINHAQRLLINTQMSMVDIAIECGFSNSNYFSDVFKKISGMSPLKYRKSYKG